MSEVLLRVRDLATRFGRGPSAVRAVDYIDFEIRRGETYALLGESGCGKSVTALSLMRLVPQPAGRIVSGRVELDDTDLLALPESQMRPVRGRRMAMIFQEPMTSLNPVLTVARQIGEVLVQHAGLKGDAQRARILELLDAVGIPDPKQRIDEYPHQLSGGMKQRVMIALALAGEPDLLIADEPTTALDVTIQAQVLDLLVDLQKRTNMAILLITHDLGVVARMADRVGVMYAGQIIEEADRVNFFGKTLHPYSKKLFQSMPGIEKRDQSLAVISGSVPKLNQSFEACRFVDRCDQAWSDCRERVPDWHTIDSARAVRCHIYSPQTEPEQVGAEKTEETTLDVKVDWGDRALLEVNNLKVYFPIHKGVFKRVVGSVKAVDDVSMRIPQGHTLALVGESGCGKTSAGKGILQLIRPTDGQVVFNDQNLTSLKPEKMRLLRSDIQIIFQDPFSSMNPRMMVGDIIEEGMVAQGKGGNAEQRSQRINELLEQVGLSTDARYRYPHEFSGGQRQRICIARALAVEPKLIICDEPTSALDVSVQAQILNLLKKLQQELGLAFLFITHNISVVAYLAHEVAVMYLGRIVEQGPVTDILENPQHPYTRALLSAVPTIDSNAMQVAPRLQGDMPSPIAPPSGCYFHPRCPHVMPRCADSYPKIKETGKASKVSCFLFDEI